MTETVFDVARVWVTEVRGFQEEKGRGRNPFFPHLASCCFGGGGTLILEHGAKLLPQFW
jgi:hypothetical protein